MALQDMMAELRGSVPKLPFAYTKTLVNRAWRRVRESHLWSFNIIEWAWISPPPVTIGACTFTQGFAAIQFDATAISAINASVIANPYAPVTVQQIRAGNIAGISQIYNVIQYNPITGAATLDRIFADPSGVNVSYNLYQNYYPAPCLDFLLPISVRNMVMFLDLDVSVTRAEIDQRDPQRSWYQFPTHAFPFTTDHRGEGTGNASATLGYTMYELWGVPVNTFSYSCYGLRRGVDLAAPTDTLPIAVGEDLVLAMARYYAYEWAMANVGLTPRTVGADFKFLMAQSLDIYGKLLSNYRRQDKERMDNYKISNWPTWARQGYYFNSIGGVAGGGGSPV